VASPTVLYSKLVTEHFAMRAGWGKEILPCKQLLLAPGKKKKRNEKFKRVGRSTTLAKIRFDSIDEFGVVGRSPLLATW